MGLRMMMRGEETHVEGITTKPEYFPEWHGDQFNLSRKKIIFGGQSYKCNKVVGDPSKKGTIPKHYQYSMVLEKKVGEKLKPLKLLLNVMSNCLASSANNKKKLLVLDSKGASYTKCHDTLKGIFSIVRCKETHQIYPLEKSHFCYNPNFVLGLIMSLREQLKRILPSETWNITHALMNNVTTSLAAIKSNWKPLGHCGLS
jgi:hypothetical protein